MPHSLFRSIPPERIGLNGEYDHSGLAKRVFQAYRMQFPAAELQDLRVTQRGRVVVLAGMLSDSELLDQLVAIALEIEGAAAVETNGIRFQTR